MKTISFWLLFVLSALMISCKKDEITTQPPAEKFMSLNSGNTWNYQQIDSPSTATPDTSDYQVKATDRDTTINSKSYKVCTGNDGSMQYYNISGSDYYTYRKLPDALGGGFVEILYLKDNLAVGGTWTQTSPVTISGYTIDMTLNNRINQKGITKTVNGITYTNVTDVATTLSIAIPIPYTLTSEIHYYYAPKVGQIENDTQIHLDVPLLTFTTDFEQETKLVSATIL